MTDMFPDPGDNWQPNLKRRLLDIDSRIDFAVFLSGKWARELYERFTAAMDHFHVSGWRRWLIVEPLAEAATLCAGGLLVMLALSGPAVQQTSGRDWLKEPDLAVTFLDRYGNKIGSRGIKHNDSVPLDEMPELADQGGIGNRGPALLRTFRHRFPRHVPRHDHERPGRRRGPGRFHPDAAARQKPVPVERAHLYAQDQ